MKNQIGSEKLTGYEYGYKCGVSDVHASNNMACSHQSRFNV